MTIDDFFDLHPEARPICDAVAAAVAGLPGVETRVQKSQIGFYRSHPFAAVWIPERHLKRKGAPLVLSVFLRRRIASPRWKEVVEPARGRYTHHLELFSPSCVDPEVEGWLVQAWEEAA